MTNEPSAEQLKGIPDLYETEHIPTEDKIIHAHFHIGQSHWLISEFDKNDTMFGYCILNFDFLNSEWGYVSYQDLVSINIQDKYQVEFDTTWVPIPASLVELIQKGGGIFSSTDSAPDKDPWTWYSIRSQPNT